MAVAALAGCGGTAAFPPGGGGDAASPGHNLSGPLQIAFCDDPAACASPPPAGPAWRTVRFGQGKDGGSFPHPEGVAWAILPFDLPAGVPREEPALFLDRLADAEEVFLNGVLLARHGVIGERLATIPGAPRVVPVPPGTLRAGRNELALRLLFTARIADALQGPIVLGDHDVLTVRAERARAGLLVVETAFLSTFLFMLVVFGFLLSHRVPRPEYLPFFLFTVLHSLVFLLGSNLLQPPGGGGPGGYRLLDVLSALRAVAMISLVATTTGAVRGAAFRILTGASLLFAAAVALSSPLWALHHLPAARKGLSLLLGAYFLYLSGRSALDRRPDAIPALLGVTAYVAATRADLFWGVNLGDYGVGFFSLCMLYTLVARHGRMQGRLLEVSTNLLAAHEEERRRIARDLHDTVGQALLALRLRLKMLASRAGADGEGDRAALSSLAGDTLAIVEDVRRAALDLRPSYVASERLSDLLRWHAASMEERSGVEIRVLEPREDAGELPPRVKENLYRIFQEAVANAVKHAEPGRIDVSLHREGGGVRLAVSDNGRGFEPGGPLPAGTGLATMRERAELLGGACRVASAPGRGTTVEVEVPVP